MTMLGIATATLTSCGTAQPGDSPIGNAALDTALTAAEKEARVFTPEVSCQLRGQEGCAWKPL